MNAATAHGMKRMAALCIALAAGGALAQSQSATDKYFDSLDLDGDGYVSIAEAAGNEEVVKRFDRGDRNHDGKLSRKEFANLKKVKVGDLVDITYTEAVALKVEPAAKK